MIAIFTLVIFWLHALTAFVADDWSYASNHLTYQVIPDKISTQPMDNLFHRINDSNPDDKLDCQPTSIEIVSVEFPIVTCLMKMDQMSIDKIILNRGNCESPSVANGETPKQALDEIKNLPPNINKVVKLILAPAMIGLNSQSSNIDIIKHISEARAGSLLSFNILKMMLVQSPSTPDRTPQQREQIKQNIADYEEAYKNIDGFIAVLNNPRYNSFNDDNPTIYKFGDRFAFLTAGCQNLIEMEIDITDGRKLKYTFQ